MDLGKYDFEELYNNYLEEINFRIFTIFLIHGIEMEFRYKGEDYFIVNGPSKNNLNKEISYWFFGKTKNDINKFSCRICYFEEKEKLIEFLENFEIDGLTLKQIFDEKMSPYEEQDKDNCMTWIS